MLQKTLTYNQIVYEIILVSFYAKRKFTVMMQNVNYFIVPKSKN